MRLPGPSRPGWLAAAALLALPLALGACAAPPRKYEPSCALTAGRIGIGDDEQSNVYGLEYRWRPFSSLRLVPGLGLSMDDDGAAYGYLDFSRDFWLDEKWVAVPSFAGGYFHESDEMKLGSKLEFRSGLEVAHVFDSGVRLGLQFYHVSNGGIESRNPGTEALVVTLRVPFALIARDEEPR